MAEAADAFSRDMSSRKLWKVGDTFQVQTEPTVEGMIAGTRWINEVFMVVFVVPMYTKKDGTHEKAAILLRVPSAISREKLDKYLFSFPTDPKIKDLVIQANGSHALLQEVLSLLNHSPIFLPLTPVADTPLCPLTSSLPVLDEPTEISDQISVELALSQAKEIPPSLQQHLNDDAVLDHLARELSKRLTFTQPASAVSHHPSPHLQFAANSTSPPQQQKDRPSRSSSRRTGSFSTSSTSRSSSASHSHKVRKHRRHRSSRIFRCPFSASDTRHPTRPSKNLHSRSEERKYLRYALHDLYNAYTTLKSFVDSLRTTVAASSTKPYTSDLLWLQHHADYLDTLLLHNSTGPWTTWNELIIDKITRAFLELAVRVSPKRKYPDLLEEPVRKWMKRKRVGIASDYGPVPSFLSQARVTDTGIEPKDGWEAGRSKEGSSQHGSSGGGRGKPPFSTTTEKK